MTRYSFHIFTRKQLSQLLLGLFLVGSSALSAQTIAEKKAGVTSGGGDFDQDTAKLLGSVNSILVEKQAVLKKLYEDVQELYDRGGPPEEFRLLLAEINQVRDEIAAAERTWRGAISQAGAAEGYALWNQPDTTLEQLVIDYGSQEYVYVIPPDIGKIKITVASSVPVPRALWGEMLEHILAQNGVGVRQLNPYLRQLYSASESQTGLRLITNNRGELEYLSPSARVGFFVTPDPSEVRRVGFFLEKFLNPHTTSLQMVGRDMLIVGRVGEIKELLKLYDFVTEHRGELEYRLVPLRRVDTEEMASVLEAMFEQFSQEEEVYESETADPASGKTSSKSRSSRRRSSGSSTPSGGSQALKVIPLKDVARAVFLVGISEEIERAERIIQEVEEAVGQARDKVVITYRVKHSDPEELAQVLSQIYELLLAEGIGMQQARAQEEGEDGQQKKPADAPEPTAPAPTIVIANNDQRRDTGYFNPFPTTLDDTPGFYQAGQVSINPTPIRVEPQKEKEYNKGRNNFLVDPRTSNIVMVLDPLLAPRVKALLRRIDVPKKMVQLDVLLIEYNNTHTNNFGLNLFSMGSCATNTHQSCARFSDTGQLLGAGTATGLLGNGAPALVQGMTEFLISREKSGSSPAFDMIYRMTMKQTDASVNSNPSIVTLNQEKASIKLMDEISISTGAVQFNETTGGASLKDAFTRAQYGTTIEITPTIHTKSDDPEDWWDDGPDYVTLDSDIIFDDIKLASDNPTRPDVFRRQIKNVARVPDGQTIILGGLKRKEVGDTKDSVPYLGEIPGVGKCFSFTGMTDRSREMFVFITPTIIYDPCEGFERVKREQFARRPGDIPYFMCAVDRAKTCEKHRAYAQGMNMLFGRKDERCVWWGDDSCFGNGGAPWSLYDGNDSCDYNGACGDYSGRRPPLHNKYQHQHGPRGCGDGCGNGDHSRAGNRANCSSGQCSGRAHW